MHLSVLADIVVVWAGESWKGLTVGAKAAHKVTHQHHLMKVMHCCFHPRLHYSEIGQRQMNWGSIGRRHAAMV